MLSVIFVDIFFFYLSRHLRVLHSFPTRRSSDLCWISTMSSVRFVDIDFPAFHDEADVPGDGDVGQRITGNVSFVMKGDRKSTRLNSSHVSISYAVFCLKKKKKKKTDKYNM